jgi:hypothetical protein
MSLTVCIVPIETVSSVQALGGHLWAYLNWALGLRALGHRVVWLDSPPSLADAERSAALVTETKALLDRYGVTLALGAFFAEPVPRALAGLCPDLDHARDADLLLNFRYGLPRDVVKAFRRSALVDIDPGLCQIWMSERQIDVAPHDRYFTIGENIGTPACPCPDGGQSWRHTPPPVCLDEWRPVRSSSGAPFTTVSNWWNDWLLWNGRVLPNDKRTSFLEIVDLPSRASVPLELALCLGEGAEDEVVQLEQKGWTVRNAQEVCPTADAYRRYVQASRGELSCAKPTYVSFGTAWISDRTLCYLASGKPAVVQHTGTSAFLPDATGLFRFRSLDEAAGHLKAIEADYDRHCREARALAEEHFDARRVMTGVLEAALE